MRNPLTIEAFAEWAEKQPVGKEYDYTDNCGCAFAQYARAIGFADPNVGASGWYPGEDAEWRDFPSGFEDALERGPHTFGALATRLRSAAQER